MTLISFATSSQMNHYNYPIIFIIYSTIVLIITGTLLSSIWVYPTNAFNIVKTMSKSQVKNCIIAMYSSIYNI